MVYYESMSGSDVVWVVSGDACSSPTAHNDAVSFTGALTTGMPIIPVLNCCVALDGACLAPSDDPVATLKTDGASCTAHSGCSHPVDQNDCDTGSFVCRVFCFLSHVRFKP